MELDPQLILAGTLVGFLVGLTGMGGGALLTPLLVLVFKVPPLAAVSSDLVTSLVMKPFGAAVHFHQGTIHLRLLTWLMVGSIPTAFIGSAIIGTIGHSEDVASGLKKIIGIALVASVASTSARLVIECRQPARVVGDVVVRPLLTVVIGAIGGLAVGLTSVGAGSLIIAMLLFAYPQLKPQQLIGTDIAQAIPLVASASLGHLIFGDVRMGLTTSLLLGAIPAVILGARLSSTAPAAVTRPIMATVLMASALALLTAPTTVLLAGAVLTGLAIIALGRWAQAGRSAHGGDELDRERGDQDGRQHVTDGDLPQSQQPKADAHQ